VGFTLLEYKAMLKLREDMLLLFVLLHFEFCDIHSAF